MVDVPRFERVVPNRWGHRDDVLGSIQKWRFHVDDYSSTSEVPPANPGTLRFHEFPPAALN